MRVRAVTVLRSALVGAVAVLGIAWLGGSVVAQVEGDRFESLEWGIGLTAPAGWRLSEQTSYPSILLWMHRTNPSGKMLLGAERLPERLTSMQYAERTSQRLAGLGYKVQKPEIHAATGAAWIAFDDGRTFFRQALLASGDTGYSLTLAAPDNRARAQHLRAFDYALRSIERLSDEAASPAGEAAAGSATAPATGATTAPARGPASGSGTATDPGCKQAPSQQGQ